MKTAKWKWNDEYMNFIFHTLELWNREINAKKNSAVKDSSDAVEKRNPEKSLAGLPLIQTLAFSISVQSATPTAIISAITLCSSPHMAAESQTTFLSHSYPIRIQLPFSGRCSSHFYGTLTPPISALLLSVPHVWMTEKSQSSHENKQSTIVTVVFCCCNKVTQVLFKIYEISSSSNQVEQMKNENGRFGDPLVQYAGESPMTPTMSTALKTSSSIGPNVL